MNRKTIFDTVRRILGRDLSTREKAALDKALDRALVGADREAAADASFNPLECVPPVPPCRVSPAGIQLIQRFEGCARQRPDGTYEAYPDPGTGGAPWTIGWGATGPGIGPGTVWSREECDARLEQDIARHAREVVAALDGSPATQAQFDALVSFHYNTGAINRATLTALHRKGEYSLAAKEFSRWRYAGGRVLKGLVRRRREEAELYMSCGSPLASLPAH